MTQSDTTPPQVESAITRIKAMTAAQPAGMAEDIAEAAAGHGRFVGLPVKIELNDDGRSAKLLEPIAYFGPDETEWAVPAGAWLDGASIPRAFWTLIGSPFTDKYREASIVHDQYCIVRTRGWRPTHRMFHEAMLCRGVGGAKARIMFYAVYRFGPRWGDPGDLAESTAAASPEPLDDAAAPSIERDARTLVAKDLSLAEIEALADASAGARPG